MLLVLPSFASQTMTTYNIYDNTNYSNVIGYYTIRNVSGSVYDIDLVVITNYGGVINNAIRTFNSNYSNSNDFDSASTDAYNYLYNNISIESNEVLGQGNFTQVVSWLSGFVDSNFRQYQGYIDSYYNLNQNYTTQIENAEASAYQDGYNAGININQTASYNTGYDTGYNAGFSEGQQASADNGYLNGYNDGVTSSNGAMRFIYAFFSAPFVFISNLFNFELFGINFYTIILTILSIVLIYFVLKFVLSRIK